MTSEPNVANRHFVAHPPHRSIGVAAGLAALRACTPKAGLAAAGRTRRPLAVCFVSGLLDYRWEESLAALQEYLQRRYRVDCIRAWCASDDDHCGLESLDDCDCMFLLARRMRISGTLLERIQRYCRRGGSIVGLRAANHAFHFWPALEREVFGGNYLPPHGNYHRFEVKIFRENQDHPVLQGVEPFISRGSLYRNPRIASDATVLLTGAIPGRLEPVAWTRRNRGGRIFYTSLGDPGDFSYPPFLRLLSNALFWTARRQPEPR